MSDAASAVSIPMAEAMAILEVNYGVEPSKERLRIWAKAMRFIPGELLIRAVEHIVQTRRTFPTAAAVIDQAAEFADEWAHWTPERVAGLIVRQVEEGQECRKVPYVYGEGNVMRRVLPGQVPTAYVSEWCWPVHDGGPVAQTVETLGGWATLASRRSDNLYAQAREAAEGVLARQRNAVRADLCGQGRIAGEKMAFLSDPENEATRVLEDTRNWHERDDAVLATSPDWRKL